MNFSVVFVVCNMVKTSLRYSGSRVVPEGFYRVFDFSNRSFVGDYFKSIELCLEFMASLNQEI